MSEFNIIKKIEHFKLLQPGIFSGEVSEDAERWLKKFENFYKKKEEWEDTELIDIAEVHFEGPARAWFEVYYTDFTSWEVFKQKFSDKFSDKQKEIIAWKDLSSIEKENGSILEITAKLSRLFKIAKVTSDREKIKHLLNKIDSKYHKIVIKSLDKSWNDLIKRLVEEEEILKTINNKQIEVDKDQDPVIVPVKNKLAEPERDSGMYEALVKKFDKMSLSLIELKEDMKNLERKKYDSRKPPFDKWCQYCKKNGHEEKFCYLKKDNKNEVNSMELDESLSNDEIMAIKRPNENKMENDAKKSKNEVILEDEETKSKIRKNYKYSNVINFMNDFDKYSVKKDLGERQVIMTFAQLLDASPSVRSELMELCKKMKLNEVDNISKISEDITNCRALIKINNKTFWSVMDTGAACSVITQKFANKQNFIIDTNSKQAIITADGMRHKTVGVVKNLPICIAGHEFPANALVLKEAAQDIILGVDWFLEHKAVINLEESELVLPKGEFDVVLSLSTKKRSDSSISELFNIIKYKDSNNENLTMDEEVKKIALQMLFIMKLILVVISQ
ncbi:hypothetical protein AYI69_g8530 [Smittium culicis]|uniref:Retrotransposon gag domain-containing protein n=1 Tax=Smittium culicis TaxID=133412 RepID=A0A1R1XIZ0_9FUNG|nr:hypothetical protein AYI69_g8530 [Smittium culicis]